MADAVGYYGRCLACLRIGSHQHELGLISLDVVEWCVIGTPDRGILKAVNVIQPANAFPDFL